MPLQARETNVGLGAALASPIAQACFHDPFYPLEQVTHRFGEVAENQLPLAARAGQGSGNNIFY